MDARVQRLARNETIFRDVNERIEETVATHAPDEHVFELVCECSNIECTLLLSLTLAAYEDVRAHPTQFVVAPGHDLPEIDEVVYRAEGYHVVRKLGDAAEVAEDRDPRS